MTSLANLSQDEIPNEDRERKMCTQLLWNDSVFHFLYKRDSVTI